MDIKLERLSTGCEVHQGLCLCAGQTVLNIVSARKDVPLVFIVLLQLLSESASATLMYLCGMVYFGYLQLRV
jgi:hypothetical protein